MQAAMSDLLELPTFRIYLYTMHASRSTWCSDEWRHKEAVCVTSAHGLDAHRAIQCECLAAMMRAQAYGSIATATIGQHCHSHQRHVHRAFLSAACPPEHCAGDTAPVVLVVLARGQLTHALAAAAFLARYLGWHFPCNMATAHHSWSLHTSGSGHAARGVGQVNSKSCNS
jgi:hypothetical protein